MTIVSEGIEALHKIRVDSLSGDIYNDLSYELRTVNIERFPYVNKVELLTKEVKTRLTTKAVTMNVKPEELFAAAVAHPAAWTALVLPDVSRQSTKKEQRLAQFLHDETGFEVVNLPASGANSEYLIKGNIVKKGTFGGDKTFTQVNKTLDLSIPKISARIVAKHTTSKGGAQDNQKIDALSFLEHQTPESKIKLILCLDGDYYTPEMIIEFRQMLTRRGIAHNTFIGRYTEVAKKISEWGAESSVNQSGSSLPV